jgi:hypothetical protein
MPEYRMQLWRKIPDTNTQWTPVIEVTFDGESDEEAIIDVIDSISPDNIKSRRR